MERSIDGLEAPASMVGWQTTGRARSPTDSHIRAIGPSGSPFDPEHTPFQSLTGAERQRASSHCIWCAKIARMSGLESRDVEEAVAQVWQVVRRIDQALSEIGWSGVKSSSRSRNSNAQSITRWV